ncbi:MAG TPA: hypothetical protein VE152_04195 [Acidimicrobiales bacterium]|nr:hypothetical protein [Acidimicrobiales bacterium]
MQFIVRKDNTSTATVPTGNRTGRNGVPTPLATVPSGPGVLMDRPALRASVGPRFVTPPIRLGN